MPPDELPNPAKEQRKIAPKRRLLIPEEDEPRQHPVRLRGLVLAVAVLLLGFVVPLCRLLTFAAGSALYSHIFLIPLISAYLVWLRRRSLPSDSEPPRQLAAFALMTGVVVLVGYWLAVGSAVTLSEEDSLALTTLSFLLLFAGICCLFVGRETLRVIAFPLAFLFFMAPFPTFVRDWIELMSQHSSAAAADVMFRLSGMPIFREGLAFQLPGIRLNVDPECSGIHSSLMLFLTSLVAGHLFLRKPWTRAVLTAAVLPLAILRNGFRIFVIGQLCVHIGPEMLYHAIHKQGGPLFFALSLVPFFLLLVVLRRLDQAVKEMKPE
ncbi:MAG: VPDSG-CTERM-specific exosortase XrtC [Verrucomicrobia bacterium]|nr:VPDSG-CTERM-specific exosortase XrtC [Verrucomicrobiota bacterium]